MERFSLQRSAFGDLPAQNCSSGGKQQADPRVRFGNNPFGDSEIERQQKLGKAGGMEEMKKRLQARQPGVK
jgi:hypothetical protein